MRTSPPTRQPIIIYRTALDGVDTVATNSELAERSTQAPLQLLGPFEFQDFERGSPPKH